MYKWSGQLVKWHQWLITLTLLCRYHIVHHLVLQMIMPQEIHRAAYRRVCVPHLGVVLLMFHELSKIFSQNLCIAVSALLMRILSWDFVCVPQACTKFQLAIVTINVISVIVYFLQIILESLQNISETTPRASTEVDIFDVAMVVAMGGPRIVREGFEWNWMQNALSPISNIHTMMIHNVSVILEI